ncbi:MAG: type II secretion system F family protein [Acidimicrobiia bacterium]
MIIEINPALVSAALATAVSVGALVLTVAPPPRRLRARIGPYTSPHLAKAASMRGGWLGAVFGPIVRDLADRLGSALDRAGNDSVLLRLRQGGWYRGLEESEMITRYRLLQLKTTATALLLGLGVAWAIRVPRMVAWTLVGLGLVIGVTRTKGRLNRAIENRREQMKIEIYTVNQLLAMRVRAGGGVIQAVKAMTQRGQGEVIAELSEALRLHRAGWSGADAFRRIAELSPEPFCTRTYRTLATAEERGADLATALLSLSEDVRETRRESIKRTATKRRAAMLVPTIAILAPVLMLFVAAPLPYLITSWQ